MGEKETATSEELERLKTKTKSNQSNDRTALDDEGGEDPERKAAEEKKKDAEQRITGSPPRASQAGMVSGRQAGGGGAEDDPGAAINNTKSNIKSRAETGIDGGIEHEDDWQGQDAAAGEADSDAERRLRDGPRNADQGFRTATVDAQGPTAIGDLNADGPARSDIAIGDPGVNDNVAGNPQRLAVSDPGAPGDKPKSK